ncbi:MAG: hypothetical protein FWF46_07070 [Oscillospiraceae bacterium]|nr:hypothetical protein [Oscillospiraceae bacterium]
MSKIWKPLGLIILIVACLFNITWKIIHKMPLAEEVKSSADYVKVTEDVIK